MLKVGIIEVYNDGRLKQKVEKTYGKPERVFKIYINDRNHEERDTEREVGREGEI